MYTIQIIYEPAQFLFIPLDSLGAVEGTHDQQRFWSEYVDAQANPSLVAQVLL